MLFTEEALLTKCYLHPLPLLLLLPEAWILLSRAAKERRISFLHQDPASLWLCWDQGSRPWTAAPVEALLQIAEGGKLSFYSPSATLAMYRNPWHTPLGAGCSPVCREGILGVLRASQTPQLHPCSRDPVPAPASVPFADFHVGPASVQGFGNAQGSPVGSGVPALWILALQ